MSVSEPSKILTPWATSGLKNAIPEAANPVTGKAGYDQGFPAINMTAKEAGGIPPFGQDFNGIFYEVTNILRYMQAGGQPTFSSALAAAIGGYPRGAIVVGSDGLTLWQNQVDGNTDDPSATPTNWVASVSGSYPVGAPIPWPTEVPPAGFLAMTGQSFSAVTYPLLALAYPALVLPDMRAEFIRGLDSGRGIDPSRAVLSSQQSAIQSHNHSWLHRSFSALGSLTSPAGSESRGPGYSGSDLGGGALITGNSGGSETRPRNIAFYYIVRTA